ncbi:MAG: glutathione S-transferase family protein [Verrucomicrobiota bacterium]
MIQLYGVEYSPFVIVQRRILEFGQVPFKNVKVPYHDRSIIWKLTKQRYYQVPVLKDGRQVLFETQEDSQVIAKYLDNKFELGLFPRELRGLQSILWRYIENEVEGLGFKLNDVYYREFVPASSHLGFLRHKERKFGRGCIDLWRAQQKLLVAELGAKLVPFEQMLLDRPYLLDNRPRFADFDLFGMLGNYLYSGHYRLPAEHTQLQAWYKRMAKIKLAELPK